MLKARFEELAAEGVDTSQINKHGSMESGVGGSQSVDRNLTPA
jgi:hypothetical protein